MSDEPDKSDRPYSPREFTPSLQPRRARATLSRVFHDEDDAGPTLVMESVVAIDEIRAAPKSDGPAAPLGHVLVVEQGRAQWVSAVLERASYGVVALAMTASAATQ